MSNNKRSAVGNQRVNPPIPPLVKGGEGGFEAGFTLIELMITMVVFVLVIAAASQVFTGLLTQFKQQSKIAETNVEGIVGLEILRQDIEHAGYGLPWVVPAGVNYQEAVAGYNDSPSNPPRAILSGNGTGFNGSDELIIKATNVARNITAQKWTYLYFGNTKKTWTPDCENVNKDSSCNTKNTVRVIVISPGSTDTNSRSLVVSGGTFFTQYNNTSGFAPTDATETRIIYGVDTETDLRMPFNRADYYISNSSVPKRCAPNTGVLEKGTINHSDGGLNALPLLDCVADMQVIYGLDNDNDEDFEPGVAGSTDGYSEDITGLTAQQIRNQVKQVRVYILAHEGQRDLNYTYPSSTISLGGDVGLGSTFNLATRIGDPEYKYYRWKVYTLVVKPNNLR